MLKIFNNFWSVIISIIILFFIIKTIINLNRPFDVNNFMLKYKNQKKLKNKLSLDNLKLGLSNIASYYIGIT